MKLEHTLGVDGDSGKENSKQNIELNYWDFMLKEYKLPLYNSYVFIVL